MNQDDAITELKALLEKRAPWEEFDSKRKAGSRMIFALVSTDAGFYECLLIRHTDSYELLKSQPNYERIGKRWCVEEEYFALERSERDYTLVPLAVQTIAPTFGSLSPIDQQTLERGTHMIRREIYLPTTKQPVQLELKFKEEDGLSFVEERLRTLHDPLALKVLYISLYQCQRNNRSSFYYYPDKVADLLGYKRDSSGYHRSANIRRIEDKFKILLDTTYRWEFPWRDGSIRLEGPLLEVSQATIELIKEGRVLAKGVRIHFYQELYEEITEHKRFAWIDMECLQWNTWDHGKAFLLYSYYSNQLSLGVREHGRKIHQKLRTILSRAGIAIGPNKRRDIDLIKREHDFLVREGFATAWEILRKAGSHEPLDDIWEITMPEDHPAVVYWRKKQKALAD